MQKFQIWNNNIKVTIEAEGRKEAAIKFVEENPEEVRKTIFIREITSVADSVL